MLQIIDAVYENGIFRPLTDIHLFEQQRVKIAFIPVDEARTPDDLPAWALALLAEESQFCFWPTPHEDIYSPENGEPVQSTYWTVATLCLPGRA